jgi:hypothetical protein
MDPRDQKNAIIIPGSIVGTLNYTRPVVLPHHELPGEFMNVLMNQIVQDFSVMTLSGTGLKLLWHQRLGHCSDEKLANPHKFADGVPKFASTHNNMENCPVSIAAKMKHRARGTESSTKATQPSKVSLLTLPSQVSDLRIKIWRSILLDAEAGPVMCCLLITSLRNYTVLQEYRKFLR